MHKAEVTEQQIMQAFMADELYEKEMAQATKQCAMCPNLIPSDRLESAASMKNEALYCSPSCKERAKRVRKSERKLNA